MMDELVQGLSQRTGLSQEKSQEVVTYVVDYLKQRLPAPLANGLDAILNGGSAQGSNFAEEAKSVAAGLEGMFGKQG